MSRTATEIAILAAARAIEYADRAEERIADPSIGSSVAAILARCAATEAEDKACEVSRLLPDQGDPIARAARAASDRAARAAERIESVTAGCSRPAATQ